VVGQLEAKLTEDLGLVVGVCAVKESTMVLISASVMRLRAAAVTWRMPASYLTRSASVSAIHAATVAELTPGIERGTVLD
jgi:hypothetical protein